MASHVGDVDGAQPEGPSDKQPDAVAEERPDVVPDEDSEGQTLTAAGAPDDVEVEEQKAPDEGVEVQDQAWKACTLLIGFGRSL